MKENDLRVERAKYCYVDVANHWEPRWRNEATQMVKGLSLQVRSQGLLVTVATLLAINKDWSQHLADVIAEWLLSKAPYRALRSSEGANWTLARRLLNACVHASRIEYVSAQREAILLLDQIKIYACALEQESA
jgi:CRISPR-associated protein Cmr5